MMAVCRVGVKGKVRNGLRRFRPAPFAQGGRNGCLPFRDGEGRGHAPRLLWTYGAEYNLADMSSAPAVRNPNADFALEIDFAPSSPDPVRVFRSMTQLIDTFQRMSPGEASLHEHCQIMRELRRWFAGVLIPGRRRTGVSPHAHRCL